MFYYVVFNILFTFYCIQVLFLCFMNNYVHVFCISTLYSYIFLFAMKLYK